MNQLLIRVLCGVPLVALAVQLPSWAQKDDTKPSQESLDKALCKAARKGNAAELERLLGQGARVDAVCSYGLMPLGYHTQWPSSKAPWTGVKYYPEVVEALLIAGASPDAADALEDAASDIDRKPGAREVFQLLLDYGADVNRPFRIEIYPSYAAYIEKNRPAAAAAVRSAAKIPPNARKARMLRRHTRDVALASLAKKLPGIEEKEKSGDEARNAGKLQEALEHFLAADSSVTQEALARELGVNPGQLTRLLRLGNLASEIQQHILALSPSIHRGLITERRLRAIARIREHWRQLADFRRLLDIPMRARKKHSTSYPSPTSNGSVAMI